MLTSFTGLVFRLLFLIGVISSNIRTNAAYHLNTRTIILWNSGTQQHQQHYFHISSVHDRSLHPKLTSTVPAFYINPNKRQRYPLYAGKEEQFSNCIHYNNTTVIGEQLSALFLSSSSDTRRQLLQIIGGTLVLTSNNQQSNAIIGTTTNDGILDLDRINSSSLLIKVPIYYISKLASYVIYYTINKQQFAAIVDTGSPFITIPSTSCTKPILRNSIATNIRGCYDASKYQNSGLKSTIERFANSEGLVQWRQGSFSFTTNNTSKDESSSNSLANNENNNNENSNIYKSNMITFGVLSESLMDGPGGVFFGLVRDTDKWIRPSFLSQTYIKSFQLDLRGTGTSTSSSMDVQQPHTKSITLSTDSEWNFNEDDNQQQQVQQNTIRKYIPLVTDLNRYYGDPVGHYTAIASSIIVNGTPIPLGRNKKLYVIIDSGVTGMVITESLWLLRYKIARTNHDRNLWKFVQINFNAGTSSSSSSSNNKHGNNRVQTARSTLSANTRISSSSTTIVQLNATRPITTTIFGDQPWPKFKNSYLIVAGLSFLEDYRLTFEIDNKRLWID